MNESVEMLSECVNLASVILTWTTNQCWLLPLALIGLILWPKNEREVNNPSEKCFFFSGKKYTVAHKVRIKYVYLFS